MSSLNLTPNPEVMAITAGIFFANFYAVKKLLLEPYLTVREQRIKATIGSQVQAEQLELENSRSVEKIRSRMVAASLEGRDFRDALLVTAKQKRDEMLAMASQEAAEVIASMHSTLLNELAEQKQAVPAIVNQLSRQFVDRLIPH
jgi:F0F1-type ATP synthase membrane subunit b/b'